jgi:hypothetical protein
MYWRGSGGILVKACKCRISGRKYSKVASWSSVPSNMVIDNEIKGRLALITGASGGYVRFIRRNNQRASS